MDILKNRNIFTFFILLSVQIAFSQKFYTRTGITEFKASVDAFEPVEAINNSTSAIFSNDGKIAAQLFISAFSFKVALMQEHFNENYMESDKYPKAIFKGTISNFNINQLSEKEYIIDGELTIKGISKKIQVPVSFSKSDKDTIILKGNFAVSPKDFNIEIPSIVRKKIANKVHITLHYEFTEKK